MLNRVSVLIVRWGRAIRQSIHWLSLHRLRTFLSTLGVLFGVAALIAILAIGEGAKQETLAQIERLGMNSIIIRQPMIEDGHKESSQSRRAIGLTWQDAEALIRNVPEVLAVAPLKMLNMKIRGAPTSLMPEIIATTSDLHVIKKLELAEGRFLCRFDRKECKEVCVLGHEVAKSLGNIGHVGQTLRLDEAPYEIVGVLKSMEWAESKHQTLTDRNFNQVIFVSLPPFIEFEQANPSRSRLSEIILEVQNTKQIHSVSKLIAHILRRLHQGDEDYQIVIPQALFQQAQRTQHTFNWVLGGIAAMSLLAGGVGIMNIMLASVFERTQEIGIRRALGANKRDIIVQFLLEAVLLTLFGGVLGAIVGIIAALAISMVAKWSVVLTVWPLLLALSMSAIVGVCSGLYPARQAARMNPIQALRHD